MKTMLSSVFLLIALSASALEIERKFTTPMVAHDPDINEAQTDLVDQLIDYMNKELTFIEGGRAPGLSQVQRFGGSAAETSHFIGLLKSAGLWEVRVCFRDFGEHDSAFILIDHTSPDLKTVEVNSGRQDFLLHHFTEHLPKLDSVADEVTIVTGSDSTNIVTISWRHGLTVLDALASRGGYLNSQMRNVHLIRDGRSRPLNIRRLARQPDLNIELRPGDRIELRQ